MADSKLGGWTWSSSVVGASEVLPRGNHEDGSVRSELERRAPSAAARSRMMDATERRDENSSLYITLHNKTIQTMPIVLQNSHPFKVRMFLEKLLNWDYALKRISRSFRL